MRKRIFTYFIIAQIIILSGLVLRIYWQQQVLGSVSVNTISKEDVISSQSGEWKYFYEPKPNTVVKDQLPGFSVATHTYNNDSLNEGFNYSIEKPKTIYRIIALGDSFTYGAFVDTKDNWPSLLEDKLNSGFNCKKFNKFEVINLGNVGYDNDYSVERYRKRGSKYNPDLVLWLQVIPTRVNEMMIPLTQEYLREETMSKEFKRELNNGIKYYPEGTKANEEIVNKLGIDNILKYQESAIKKILNYYTGPLTLFVIPGMQDNRKKMLEQTVKEVGFWSYFDGLRNYYNVNGAFPDAHPNQKGHQMIAEDVFNYLKNSKLIPCN